MEHARTRWAQYSKCRYRYRCRQGRDAAHLLCYLGRGPCPGGGWTRFDGLWCAGNAFTGLSTEGFAPRAGPAPPTLGHSQGYVCLSHGHSQRGVSFVCHRHPSRLRSVSPYFSASCLRACALMRLVVTSSALSCADAGGRTYGGALVGARSWCHRPWLHGGRAGREVETRTPRCS